MADLSARRDSWLDYLPGNTQQAINTSPVVNALSRLLSRPSSPDASYQAQRSVLGPDIADQQWLEQQAKPPGWLDRLSPTARDNFNTLNTLAMFLGPRARIADRAALARAQQKTAAGVPREQVWKEDGWFHGPDGKWRFEIDDSGFSALGSGRTLGDVAPHPDLYAAYPEMSRVKFRPSEHFGDASYQPQSIVRRETIEAHPSDASSLLHELQHAVQRREGFARGSSPAFEEFSVAYGGNGIKEKARYLADALRGRNVQLERDAERAAMNTYRSIAGEVEARAVERRMGLSPAERQQSPPWLYYDVPEDRQIVRQK